MKKVTNSLKTPESNESMLPRNYLVATIPLRHTAFIIHTPFLCPPSVPILPLPLAVKNPVFSMPSDVLLLIVTRAPSLSSAYANTSVNRPNVTGSRRPKTADGQHQQFRHRQWLSQKQLITPGMTRTHLTSWMRLPMKTSRHPITNL